MKRTCLGIDNYARPKPEYITCSNCGSEVEIWTDEDDAECTDCGLKVSRNMQSCLEWCEYADKCKQIIEKNKNVRSSHED
jgi:hypothetical protein